MRFRKKMSKRASRKVFKKYSGSNKRNFVRKPIMRGGIRL